MTKPSPTTSLERDITIELARLRHARTDAGPAGPAEQDRAEKAFNALLDSLPRKAST